MPPEGKPKLEQIPKRFTSKVRYVSNRFEKVQTGSTDSDSHIRELVGRRFARRTGSSRFRFSFKSADPLVRPD